VHGELQSREHLLDFAISSGAKTPPRPEYRIIGGLTPSDEALRRNVGPIDSP
jgi:hypothetical protein